MIKKILHGVLLTISTVLILGEPKEEYIVLAAILKIISFSYIGIMIFVNFYWRKDNMK